MYSVVLELLTDFLKEKMPDNQDQISNIEVCYTSDSDGYIEFVLGETEYKLTMTIDENGDVLLADELITNSNSETDKTAEEENEKAEKAKVETTDKAVEGEGDEKNNVAKSEDVSSAKGYVTQEDMQKAMDSFTDSIKAVIESVLEEKKTVETQTDTEVLKADDENTKAKNESGKTVDESEIKKSESDANTKASQLTYLELYGDVAAHYKSNGII